jgi:lipopolysaccharide transport system ATP-binding protein
MNKHIAIRIENLGKRYKIGAQRRGYRTLRDTLTRALSFPFRRNSRPAEATSDFWALEDVSLEIKPGEVVGIIGRNGAGKTTLLKILSRITEPTTGRVEVYGRVASLLEVGTGFHPELTGRENIYLNGAILGMRKAEIDRKFDEMVAFAEVERFIDTPVKHYSSGMYVRLAFGVAAHLEPEILLVDEVLAVGDAAFQEKCLGKMNDVAKGGRTVLFVSHNLQAIRQLCDQVYLLDAGHLLTKGPPDRVIATYLNGSGSQNLAGLTDQVTDKDLTIKSVKIIQDNYEFRGTLIVGKPFELHIEYQILNLINNLLMGFDLFSNEGVQIIRAYDYESCGRVREPGNYLSICRFPGWLLNNGSYYLELIIGIHRGRWISRGKIRIKLKLDGPRTTDIDYPGVIAPSLSWDVTKTELSPSPDLKIK